MLAFHVHNRLRHLLSPRSAVALLEGFRRRAGLEPGDKVMPHYRGLAGLYLHLFTRREVEGLLREAGLRPRRVEALRADRRGFLRGPAASLRADGFLVSAVKE